MFISMPQLLGVVSSSRTDAGRNGRALFKRGLTKVVDGFGSRSFGCILAVSIQLIENSTAPGHSYSHRTVPMRRHWVVLGVAIDLVADTGNLNEIDISGTALPLLFILAQDNKVQPERCCSIGYGEYRPIDSNDTKTGRVQNRRVEM